MVSLLEPNQHSLERTSKPSSKDYAKGFVYNFEEGASFIIPHAVRVFRRGQHCYGVRTTGPVELSLRQEKP